MTWGFLVLIPLWGWAWRRRALQTTVAAAVGFYLARAVLFSTLSVGSSGGFFQRNLLSTVAAPIVQQDAPNSPASDPALINRYNHCTFFYGYWRSVLPA